MQHSEVGIITMHKVLNFGSVLQVYGLYLTVKNLGYNPIIIDYIFPNSYQTSRRKKTSLIRKILNRKFKYIIRNKIGNLKGDLWSEQRIRFNEFYRDYLTFSKEYKTREEILEDPPIVDIVITGSDQVWNPHHTYGDPTFFCDFAPAKPKISFSSSFSVNNLEPKYKEQYRNLLKDYISISVREESGITILKELCISEASITCDPSLLLNKQDYIELSKKSNIKIEQPYILAYILDYNLNPHPAIDKLTKKISKKLNTKVIFLECGSIQGNNNNGNQMIFSAGPIEFLWLIANAEAVITSSFHGAAFSILMEKDFYAVTDNKNMDGRIGHLCNKFGLSSRLIERNSKIKHISFTPINWSHVTPIVDSFRNDSVCYLKKALKQCQEEE